MQRLIVVTMRAFRAVRALRGTSQRCGMAHRVHERAAVSSVTRLYIQQSKRKTLPLRSTKTRVFHRDSVCPPSRSCRCDSVNWHQSQGSPSPCRSRRRRSRRLKMMAPATRRRKLRRLLHRDVTAAPAAAARAPGTPGSASSSGSSSARPLMSRGRCSPGLITRSGRW